MKNLFKSFILTLLVLASLVLFCACSKAKPSVDDLVGTYVNKYQEEMDGSVIDLKDEITLKSDMTCEVIFQDKVSGTWDLDGNITIGDTASKYTIDGDKLTLKESDGFTRVFTKEK